MDAIIDENKKSWLQRFILWREKKIKEKLFILILSFLVFVYDCVHSFFYSLIIFTSPPLPSLIMLDGLGCPTSSCLYSTI